MKISLVLPIISLSLIHSISGYALCTKNPVIQADSTLPSVLTGKLVYHSYTLYGDGSSNLFLKDFHTNESVQLNDSSWNIDDPMNAHFAPNGRTITFMGRKNNFWNIFVWTIGSSRPPVNLSNHTAVDKGRSEDPKFSADGNYITYKKNSDIAVIHLNQTDPEAPFVDGAWNVTNNGYLIEESMPSFSADTKAIFFSRGAGAASSIYRVNVKINTRKLTVDKPVVIAAKPGVAEYYPVAQNQSVFFVSWKDAIAKNDQISFLPNALKPTQVSELSFNDCNADNSDPIPIDESHVIFSSIRNGHLYHLYLANIKNGKVWTLNKFGVNDVLKNQLGTTYSNVY